MTTLTQFGRQVSDKPLEDKYKGLREKGSLTSHADWGAMDTVNSFFIGPTVAASTTGCGSREKVDN